MFELCALYGLRSVSPVAKNRTFRQLSAPSVAHGA
jgi:hypothetical protein